MKRGAALVSIATAGPADQTSASSPAMAAVSSVMSAAAEGCSASATINVAVVSLRTADSPLCRFVHRRACARPASSAKITSRTPGCSTSPENVM